jgi:hypothetical protein
MTGRGVARPALVALVALASLLAAGEIVRTAAVADRTRHPLLAAALWPGHPALMTDRLLLEVASAAVHGQAVPDTVSAQLRLIAKKAPLSPDPYLVQAAIMETQGKGGAAEKLLLAARDRDPRSRGTRFFLADRFLRTGRVVDGLNEIRVLAGLHDKGAEGFLPMLAAYAKTPGSAANLKPLFRQHPGLEAGVLSLLALDVRNADLVLALASPGAANPEWLGLFAGTLVQDGQIAKAHAAWTELSGAQSSGLFNASFAASKAPPPFNWAYSETPEGVAEPDGKGGLELLYYGRASAVLARQLMTLDAGTYRISHAVADATGPTGSLHWTARCAKPDRRLAETPLRAGSTSFVFQVPDGCEGVWLELAGLASETPTTTGLTIRDLRLAGAAD